MKVLIAVDQSDLAIMSFRSFMTQFAKDDMELQSSMMEMRRNSSGVGAIAIAGLMKENDLDNEADALIHFIKNELKFENKFQVSYCKLQGSNPRLVINMVSGYIEEIEPDRIMFGCRGYVRLPESEDQTHDISTFRKASRLVRHKKCENCTKELTSKREVRRMSLTAESLAKMNMEGDDMGPEEQL